MKALITRQWQERQVQLQMCPQPIFGKGDPFGCAFLSGQARNQVLAQQADADSHAVCLCQHSSTRLHHGDKPTAPITYWEDASKPLSPLCLHCCSYRLVLHQAAQGAPGPQVSPQLHCLQFIFHRAFTVQIFTDTSANNPDFTGVMFCEDDLKQQLNP